MADSTGYDPKRSRVSDDKMNEFMRQTITGDLTEVPGIGPAAVVKLAQSDVDGDVVTNTFQLIGKFLMLKGPDRGDDKVGTREHMEKFWYWLQEKGISSHRSGIVRCIAERMNAMMPGIYDAAEYEDDDDSSDEE